MRHATPPSPATRFLRQALLGLAFVGLVAVLSLPAARGTGPVGWMPMWLLGMPLAGLGVLTIQLKARRGAARLC